MNWTIYSKSKHFYTRLKKKTDPALCYLWETSYRVTDTAFMWNDWEIYSMPTSTKERIGYTVLMSSRNDFY